MPQRREIYLLDPKILSPETIAVTFAKTSRSAQTFREIAAELTDEKSADFHEKWVVGYGHSSIAEHAVLHIAVENLSRLAVECLESNRLAAYTEKSSRYQIWDEDHFYIPPELSGHPLESEYVEVNTMLFKHYQQAVRAVTEYLKVNQPQKEKESDRGYEQRMRTCCADVCRFYLPASALANVGMSINARSLEHALSKMLSHNLAEVREIGQEIKQVAQANVPTLVKYADENDYLKNLDQIYSQTRLDPSKDTGHNRNWFTYIGSTENGEEKVLAALYHRFGQASYKQCLDAVSALSFEEKQRMAADLLGTLSEFDIPARELEYAHISLDVVLDQGAYFELKRHRMMTQTPQRLTTHLDYAVPSLLEKAGLSEQFKADMEIVKLAYGKISQFNVHVAAYIISNAFNRRVLLQMNLRSALHFIKLRSAPNAHFSMRQLALRLAEELRDRFPLFSPYFLSGSYETWQSISGEHFSRLQ